MRIIACAALVVATFAVQANAAEPRKLDRRLDTAVSADRFAVRANYVEGGHGYSERARHISACLATYPTYNWRTDRVQVRPGVTRRCEL